MDSQINCQLGWVEGVGGGIVGHWLLLWPRRGALAAGGEITGSVR